MMKKNLEAIYESKICCDLFIDKKDKDFSLTTKLSVDDTQVLHNIKLQLAIMNLGVKLNITMHNEKTIFNISFKSSIKFDDLIKSAKTKEKQPEVANNIGC